MMAEPYDPGENDEELSNDLMMPDLEPLQYIGRGACARVPQVRKRVVVQMTQGLIQTYNEINKVSESYELPSCPDSISVEGFVTFQTKKVKIYAYRNLTF